jgi:hypothetical protein
MDYYEELGLKPTATVPEIRQAYKVFARLVHPDGQPNQQIRQMAERQMTRLNEILATLTDEQARREYDAGLATAARLAAADVRCTVRIRPPQPPDAIPGVVPGWLHPIAGNWFWIALGCMVVGVAMWYSSQTRLESAVSAQAVAPADNQPATPAKPDGKARNPVAPPERNEVKTAARDTPADLENFVPRPVESSTSTHSDQPQATLRAPAPVDPPVTLVEPASVPAAGNSDPAITASGAGPQKPGLSPFAGNWLFVPDTAAKPQPGAYSATYVELLLREERARISGNYRAQYQVPDRAVSPEVSFQVTGDRPAGLSASFQWMSADGARGEIEMAITGPNAMKVTWWTTEFGRSPSLASGSARLIRQAP